MESAATPDRYRPNIPLRLLVWLAIYIGCVAAMYVCMPEYNAPWYEMLLWPIVGLENLTTRMLQPYIPNALERQLAIYFVFALYPLHLIAILILANRKFYRLLMSLLISLMALSFFGAVFTSGWGDLLRNHGFKTLSPNSPIPGASDSDHYDR